jgi:hypothetical protein
MGFKGLWTGQTSTDWNTSTNWHNHDIPDASVAVIIDPSVAIQWPTHTGDLTIGTQCDQLLLMRNTQLNITGDLIIPPGEQFDCDGDPVISLTGDWVNYGTFVFDSSLVKMTGASNALLSGIDTTFGLLGTTLGSNPPWNSNYFDVNNIGPQEIDVYAFDIHCSSAGAHPVEVWYAPVSYVGNTSNPIIWTRVGNPLIVNANSIGTPTRVVPDTVVTIPAGVTYGFFISCYNSGSSFGEMVNSTGLNTYSNADIMIFCDDASGTNQPGGGSLPGNVFNGAVYYNYTTRTSVDFFDLEIDKTNATVRTHGDVNVKNDLDVNSTSDLHVTQGDSLNVKK